MVTCRPTVQPLSHSTALSDVDEDLDNLPALTQHVSLTSGRFRLVRSMFGCGFILTGSHPAIAASENVLCDHAKEVVNHATLVMDTVPMVTWNMAVACLKLPEFFETEGMGISMPKTCRGWTQTVIFREKDQELVVKRWENLMKKK